MGSRIGEPLLRREVVRKGVRATIPVRSQPAMSGSGQVSDFAIAVMEGGI